MIPIVNCHMCMMGKSPPNHITQEKKGHRSLSKGDGALGDKWKETKETDERVFWDWKYLSI